MEEDIIEIQGKKIDLSKLSNEELIELYQEAKKMEESYKQLVETYRENFPFLKTIE